MAYYCFSTHPVWITFNNLGLPDDIINIIFSYRTFFTPINITKNEYNKILNNYINSNYIYDLNYPDITEHICGLLSRILFINSYSNNTINFILNFGNLYKNFHYYSNKDITELFKKYYYKKINSFPKEKFNNSKYICILTLRDNIFESNIVKEGFVSSNLKELLKIKFRENMRNLVQKNIRNTSNYNNLSIIKKSLILDIKFLWKNIINVLKSDVYELDKNELMVLNLMAGCPYKIEWNKKQLKTNLYKIPDILNNQEYLYYLNILPDQYNMKSILNKMKKEPFSSINTKRNNEIIIDYPKTLKNLCVILGN